MRFYPHYGILTYNYVESQNIFSKPNGSLKLIGPTMDHHLVFKGPLNT